MQLKIINVSGKDDDEEDIKINRISVGDLLKNLDIDAFGIIVTRNGKIAREHDILHKYR
ncbi:MULTISPECIES: hypothetical protein [Methanobacterium]|jgi:sulfur carrier protein ThiS|uniref:hypothetical protein n=1 Tax=Methanobacterium TaxID=2160 RepID=UPI00159F0EA7|nr:MULTISPECIES: hypothetical protein [Methanobacterium]